MRAPLPEHLGQVISGFKAGCRKAEKALIAAAEPQPTENVVPSQQVPSQQVPSRQVPSQQMPSRQAAAQQVPSQQAAAQQVASPQAAAPPSQAAQRP